MNASSIGEPIYGSFHPSEHLDLYRLKSSRQLIEYDAEFHKERAVYFPGRKYSTVLLY